MHSVVVHQLAVLLSWGWTRLLQQPSSWLLQASAWCTNFNEWWTRLIFGGDGWEHITPLLHDKLHWLHASERTDYMFISLHGAERYSTTLHTGHYVCWSHNMHCCPLSHLWRPHRPSYHADLSLATVHSVSLHVVWRGTVCHLTFKLHQNCPLWKTNRPKTRLFLQSYFAAWMSSTSFA